SLDSLDVDELRTHTTYSSGYHREHYVIEMFWEVIKSFSVENQKKFLKFVTGCSRGPLLGLKYLEPCFCIQRKLVFCSFFSISWQGAAGKQISLCHKCGCWF
ncbi:hypothetical protein Csa_021498, partial [Cucumis sativus]